MIDPITGWLEEKKCDDNKATKIRKLVENTWPYR